MKFSEMPFDQQQAYRKGFKAGQETNLNEMNICCSICGNEPFSLEDVSCGSCTRMAMKAAESAKKEAFEEVEKIIKEVFVTRNSDDKPRDHRIRFMFERIEALKRGEIKKCGHIEGDNCKCKKIN